jgi:hypothetical protein
MLITKPQVHIISREVTTPSGELVRAYFAVIDVNGVLEVKFLGTKPIEAKADDVLLLENAKVAVYAEAPLVSPFERVSHYFTLDYLVHQLARAPSRR